MITKNDKKKTGLTTRIFIALISGAIVGILFHYFLPESYIRDTIFINGIFYLAGQGFIRLMQMIVVPLVFCSIICGASSIGDTKTLGSVGIKTVAFYLVTTAIAVTLALVIGNLIDPGLGLDMSSIQSAENVATQESKPFVDILLDIIPKNPINALANGDMLPIILFALIVGIILAKLAERSHSVFSFFLQFNDIMMEMTSIVMNLAPVGVFCLIARTFAGIGFDAFIPMLKYIAAVILALALQCFGVYQIFLKLLTGLNPVKFVKKFFPVMAFAFSTASSNATIPLSIETLDARMGISKKISSFTIPLGATINMDGTAIMQGVAVVFASQAFGIELGLSGYLTVITTATLASIGTAGVPSVGLVTLSMVFTSVGLPVEAIALIMGVDRIVDMSRTAVNITGDAVCTTIIACKNGSFDKEIFNNTN